MQTKRWRAFVPNYVEKRNPKRVAARESGVGHELSEIVSYVYTLHLLSSTSTYDFINRLIGLVGRHSRFRYTTMPNTAHEYIARLYMAECNTLPNSADRIGCLHRRQPSWSRLNRSHEGGLGIVGMHRETESGTRPISNRGLTKQERKEKSDAG